MGKLVWLASYPKSGNTWLRAFLHNYLTQTESPHDINRLHELTLGESDSGHFRRHDPRASRRYTLAEVQRLRPLVHRDFMAAGPTLVFVKTHNASLVVAGVPTVTPEVTAGAIYIVRDPRDVAVSYARHLDRSIDATIALMATRDLMVGGDDAHVQEIIGSWSVHVHFWTRNPNPRLLVLRYEDLLADPARWFGDVIRFLGEDPPPERLARAVAFSSFDVLRAQEISRGFVERPGTARAFFRAGEAGQWRAILSPEQAAAIARDHRAEMQRFGYL
jgi:hypothetical protein